MNKKSNQPYEYEMELDEAYYNRLLKADFIEIDDMIFIEDHLKNLDLHIRNLQQQKREKIVIEQQLNHIVMEFISTFYEKQKALAENIIKSWKKTLKRKFPNKKFIIELVDEGGGYVIYLYQKRVEEKSQTADHKI